MQAAAEERAAAAEAREMETVRLRAQQQRAADTQAQIDELRARRCVSTSNHHHMSRVHRIRISCIFPETLLHRGGEQLQGAHGRPLAAPADERLARSAFKHCRWQVAAEKEERAREEVARAQKAAVQRWASEHTLVSQLTTMMCGMLSCSRLGDAIQTIIVSAHRDRVFSSMCTDTATHGTVNKLYPQ
jgi:hypothetical protein